jgi:hypothetical protein
VNENGRGLSSHNLAELKIKIFAAVFTSQKVENGHNIKNASCCTRLSSRRTWEKYVVDIHIDCGGDNIW